MSTLVLAVNRTAKKQALKDMKKDNVNTKVLDMSKEIREFLQEKKQY